MIEAMPSRARHSGPRFRRRVPDLPGVNGRRIVREAGSRGAAVDEDGPIREDRRVQLPSRDRHRLHRPPRRRGRFQVDDGCGRKWGIAASDDEHLAFVVHHARSVSHGPGWTRRSVQLPVPLVFNNIERPPTTRQEDAPVRRQVHERIEAHREPGIHEIPPAVLRLFVHLWQVVLADYQIESSRKSPGCRRWRASSRSDTSGRRSCSARASRCS